MTDFALARRNMVDGQLRPNRVTNAALLAAVSDLPRERFLPDGLRSVAYADDDVPLGNGRFLMEPMVLARLIQALQPQPEDKVLVVASGRGYGAALLSRLVKSVVAVESDVVRRKASRRCPSSTGFTKKSSAPASRHRTSLSSPPCPVSIIVGSWAIAAFESWRSRLSTSAPSMPGMSKSSNRSEGGSAWSEARASIPSETCAQEYPAPERMRTSSFRLVASSSATKIRSVVFLAIFFL